MLNSVCARPPEFIVADGDEQIGCSQAGRHLAKRTGGIVVQGDSIAASRLTESICFALTRELQGRLVELAIETKLIGEKVRSERRWTSGWVTPARKTTMAIGFETGEGGTSSESDALRLHLGNKPRNVAKAETTGFARAFRRAFDLQP